ncbi:heavy metal translocating P-type ATPase [Vagococcus fessus]|uniref:Heavy metal translocating P-type ATPase n=1 Tax=Vagococcus fessus TaxID=120370 RepID=A0A430A5H4_9ENTE|nr:heavy metal translocating P-type ATPase [Vagococcus fessus]RSU02065.1 heavy metal translocating P-type ATPase [Vagococcus fessus]
MTKLSHEKQVMISTALCGIFMVIGWVLDKTNNGLAPFIFVTGMVIGGYFQTKEGITETIEEKHLSVDLLMALAAIGACLIGYWFEGIMLTFIFSLSGSLEEYTTNKSKREIYSLLEMQPENALRLLPDQSTEEVAVEELVIGETLLVPKGANIPIDGMIIKGDVLCDEASITGESLPVEKFVGEDVFAGTINLGNAFEMTVSKNSSDTLFSKIVQLVEEAQNTPSKTSSFLDRIENTYVKIVLLAVPLMILIPYFFLGWTWNESFYRGMVLLVVASPCALVASATPATLAAISSGARNGVLFKGGVFLEQLSDLKAISFDKTGTLTKGKPAITDAFFLNEGKEKEDSLNTLFAMEKTSTHPLAQAVTSYFRNDVTEQLQNINIQDMTGSGMLGLQEQTEWRIGNLEFATTKNLEDSHIQTVEQLQEEGKTVIFLSKNNQITAFFGLLDIPKKEAISTIKYFQEQGIKTVMMTGDHPKTANAVGKMLNIDEIHASCTPETKTNLIKTQQETYGVNAMIGDGVNDAPALANASIGVAMGQGTDIAIDVADVVLMQDDISKLQMAHRLSKKLKRIVTQNIIFSVSVICLLIISNFFKIISLPIGVIGHEGSTILVILNGLRLLRTQKTTD